MTAQQALANVLAGARGEQVPFGAPGRPGKKRNFDEAVDIHLKLGLDPRKPNQQGEFGSDVRSSEACGGFLFFWQ